MKKLITICLVCVVFTISFVEQTSASPALPVTKPPLQPVPSYTGPPGDPHAIQGQWFKDHTTKEETVRPYEFYDNVYEHGGSLGMSYCAIQGLVRNIVRDGSGNITSFGIRATIYNDDSESIGPWQEGSNLHGESTSTRERYICNMYDVKLTVDFADDGIQFNLPMGGPYRPEQNIYAIDYDELAWYCWTPENPLK